MIYHYTSIETLALILHHKKIRFNSINEVNDIHESTGFKKLTISNYLFVSCWTENPEENIVLWNMYSKNMKGVRIGLNNPPFKMKKVNSATTKVDIKIIGEKYMPLTFDECKNDNYFVFPFFSTEDNFFKKIEYLDDEDLNNRYSDMIKITKTKKNINASINSIDLGKIKHKRWSFEEESRFVLFILPPIDNLNNPSEAINKIANGFPLGISFFDLELDPNILKDMEIVLGPNCSESDKYIVDSLLNKYEINNVSRNSILRNIIRSK